MSKLKSVFRIAALLLIITILFTSCEIPDISKFTETSAEMTRAIRKGVNDTADLLGSASKNDLFDAATKNELAGSYKDFKDASKPTMKVLEGIDSYLEALNALAASNKKSGENAQSVVDSVDSLVSVVTGSALPSIVGKASVWLLTSFNEFKTERSFKKRVEKVSEIMEGKKNSAGQKLCTELNVNSVLDSKQINEEQRRDALNKLGCGVVDILKWNLRDLQGINNNLSEILYARTLSKNEVTLEYHSNIQANDKRIQTELSNILRYKELVAKFDQFEKSSNLELKVFESRTQNNYRRKIDAATTRAEKERLEKERDKKLADERKRTAQKIEDMKRDSRDEIQSTLDFVISLDRSLESLAQEVNGKIIFNRLEEREKQLIEQTKLFASDLQRISPSYSDAVNELEQIRNKQKQLDSLLDSGVDALDAWEDTHANLRKSLETNQTLTVSRLASKVRELWEILKPAEAA